MQQGLREPRPSADVDVLIDPAGFGALIDDLIARRWRSRGSVAQTSSAIRSHAVSLVHAEWPCDLDCHYYFVGTFAAPGASFDALWDDHVEWEIGGSQATLPSMDGHRLLLAINTVRDTGTPVATREAPALAEQFRSDPESWQNAQCLAAQTRSLSVLREFALRHGLPAPEHDLSEEELGQLHLAIRYKAGGMGNLRYLLTARSLTVRERLRRLRPVLVKTPSELAARDASFGGGIAAAAAANLRRAGKGLRRSSPVAWCQSGCSFRLGWSGGQE